MLVKIITFDFGQKMVDRIPHICILITIHMSGRMLFYNVKSKNRIKIFDEKRGVWVNFLKPL